MAQPVPVRRLTEQEGQGLQHVVRRGSGSSVRFRRVMMLLALAGGSTVPVIARLVQVDEDTVRDLIHKFNAIGRECLNPRWAGSCSRLLDRDDEGFVVQVATPRPTAGSSWAEQGRPDRLPATFRRTRGVTYFHSCSSVGDDQMWGINRRRKGIDHTWATLRTVRAGRRTAPRST